MPMFRTNLIVVEARQLIGTATQTMDIVDWVRNNGYPWLLGNALEPETLIPEDGGKAGDVGLYIDPKSGNLVIHEVWGDVRAGYGDWIVRDSNGEFHTYKPYAFEDKYDPA